MKKKLFDILIFLIATLILFGMLGLAVGMFLGFVWLLQYSLTIFSVNVEYWPLVAFVFVVTVIMNAVKNFIKK